MAFNAFVLQIRLVDNTLVPLIHAAIKELDEQARFDIFFQDPRQSGY